MIGGSSFETIWPAHERGHGDRVVEEVAQRPHEPVGGVVASAALRRVAGHGTTDHGPTSPSLDSKWRMISECWHVGGPLGDLRRVHGSLGARCANSSPTAPTI